MIHVAAEWPQPTEQIRRDAATDLLRAGVPVKVVSERLGHRDIATTLRVYAHVLPDMQDAAADAVGRLMGDVAP